VLVTIIDLQGARRLTRKFGPAVLLTVASQGISAASIFALVLLGHQTSDTYALLLQVGNATLAGFTFGVLYLWAIGRPGMANWAVWAIVSVAFSMTLSAAVYAFSSPGADHGNLPLFILFGAGGGILAAAGTYAVKAACQGRPHYLVGLTIVPNVGLLLGTLVTATMRGGAVPVLPGLTWLVGCCVSLILSLSGASAADLGADGRGARNRSTTKRNDVVHLLSLGAGVVASTIVPSFLLGSLAGLSAGVISVAFIVTRIGSSIVGVGINALLSVKYHWAAEDRWSEKAPAALLGMATIAVLLSLGAGSLSFGDGWWPVALFAGGWMLAASGTPLLSREVHARRMGGASAAKVALDVCMSLAALAALRAEPSLLRYFAALTLSQAVTAVVFGRSLRVVWPTASALVLGAAAVGVLFF
jgi:hypothetical protein